MGNPTYPNLNALWGGLIVEELVRNGVDYFCIAPGSRSAPLTAAVAKNQKAKSFVHFDERGVAFHALGYISVTNRPAAVICTSGTAAANFLPAIVEASKKKLPLIVLTADRPPELQKTGADQTIEQNNIYGQFVKWHLNMPCPTDEIKPEYVLTTADQAVFQSKAMIPGPVHLNCAYREPLAPAGNAKNFSPYLKTIRAWFDSDAPYTRYVQPVANEAPADNRIFDTINKIKNGIIAVGKLSGKKEAESVLKLAEKLNWPIFPDVTSGLRLGNTNRNIIHYYDQMLLSKNIFRNRPDGILHLGGRMCSKRYYQFVDTLKPRHYITVLSHFLRNDPLHCVTLRVQSKVEDFCSTVVDDIPQRPDAVFSAMLKKQSEVISAKINRYIAKSTLVNEVILPRIVTQAIPSQHGLFLASSMPIRDMDMYATHSGNSVIIGSNRGASGIDGTIATAVGFAFALNKPTTLVIGDLAFLHDINSLAMVKVLKKPLIVILINNNGGGIFNFLPISKRRDIFERYFAAPHHFSFESTGAMFRMNHAAVKSKVDFIRTYKKALSASQSTIIEIKSQREENLKNHRKLQKTLAVN